MNVQKFRIKTFLTFNFEDFFLIKLKARKKQKLSRSNFNLKNLKNLIKSKKFNFLNSSRVSENSKLNSMDSKNLAICWWPTLLPIEFTDMLRFESMRPYLEDIVQTMIDQYPFLFCGQEAFVMV